jgi:hypothetical protein
MAMITVRDDTQRGILRRWGEIAISVVGRSLTMAIFAVLLFRIAYGPARVPAGTEYWIGFLTIVFKISVTVFALLAVTMAGLEYRRRKAIYAEYGLPAMFGGTKEEIRLLCVDLPADALASALRDSSLAAGEGHLADPGGVRLLHKWKVDDVSRPPRPIETKLQMTTHGASSTCLRIVSRTALPRIFFNDPLRYDCGEALRCIETLVSEIRRCVDAVSPAPRRQEE